MTATKAAADCLAVWGHKRHNEAKSEPTEAERKPEEGVDEFIKRFENGDSVSQAQQNAAENVEKAIDGSGGC